MAIGIWQKKWAPLGVWSVATEQKLGQALLLLGQGRGPPSEPPLGSDSRGSPWVLMLQLWYPGHPAPRSGASPLAKWGTSFLGRKSSWGPGVSGPDLRGLICTRCFYHLLLTLAFPYVYFSLWKRLN